MRKVLLLIISILLIIPTVVFAETCTDNNITIEEIKLVDKSAEAKELESAKLENKKINLNIEMSSVGDYLTYEIFVKNGTEEDYALDKSSFQNKSDYFEYIFDTKETIIKPGESKKMRFSISYKKEIPANEYKEYVFGEKQNFNLSFNPTKVAENPPTGVADLIYAIPVIVIMIMLNMAVNKRRKLFKAISVIIIILIPYIVNASCKTEFSFQSTITINQCKAILITEEGSFSLTADEKELCLTSKDVFDDYVFKYYPDMLGIKAPVYKYFTLNIDRTYFTNESYINVYSDLNKTNLIQTVTIDSFPKPYYAIEETLDLSKESISVPLDNADYSYTLSPDLQQIADSYYNEHGTELNIVDPRYSWFKAEEKEVKGLMTTNENIINKLENLHTTLMEHPHGSDVSIRFISCDEYKKELENYGDLYPEIFDEDYNEYNLDEKCENNRYYARYSWAIY